MNPFPIARIKREVARHYRIPLRTMSQPHGLGSRSPEHCQPRMVAMCLATRLTEHSLVRIGQFFGNRDHSTVIYAERIASRRDKDALRTLTKRLLFEAGVCV